VEPGPAMVSKRRLRKAIDPGGFCVAATYVVVGVAVFVFTSATTKQSNVELDWLAFALLGATWSGWGTGMLPAFGINTGLMYLLGTVLYAVWQRITKNGHLATNLALLFGSTIANYARACQLCSSFWWAHTLGESVRRCDVQHNVQIARLSRRAFETSGLRKPSCEYQQSPRYWREREYSIRICFGASEKGLLQLGAIPAQFNGKVRDRRPSHVLNVAGNSV